MTTTRTPRLISTPRKRLIDHLQNRHPFMVIPKSVTLQQLRRAHELSHRHVGDHDLQDTA